MLDGSILFFFLAYRHVGFACLSVEGVTSGFISFRKKGVLYLSLSVTVKEAFFISSSKGGVTFVPINLRNRGQGICACQSQWRRRDLCACQSQRKRRVLCYLALLLLKLDLQICPPLICTIKVLTTDLLTNRIQETIIVHRIHSTNQFWHKTFIAFCSFGVDQEFNSFFEQIFLTLFALDFICLILRNSYAWIYTTQSRLPFFYPHMFV